ncbi:hypothetical protein EX30DRAFT_346531 [Ascodesmis nigricans]|uniref:Uncharacterized protein n=1 Tax=Ascodesmis nigricans TaxID=341454 RepID=A0A4S2N3S4_9PEZI|nr:hypothetical protein EX30DRAFT_346531 [Ascodesmis nigricans]
MSLQDSIYADADDFAQTRGADDLFESEIQPAPLPSPPSNAPNGPRTQRGRRNSSGHRGGHRRQSDARRAPVDAPEKLEETDNTETGGEPRIPTAADGRNAPAAAATGNRLMSGGVSKPKLTEEELAARMEKIRLNNKKLTERRKAAEEDETNFEKQEALRKQSDAKQRLLDRKKRIEAEKNRREMNEERERNRQRKLKAFQTREWDVEKKEEDYNPSSLPRYRRGAHGAVVGGQTTQSRPNPPAEQNNPPQAPTSPAEKMTSPKADTKTEWPALPGAEETPKADVQSKPPPISWAAEVAKDQSSWADQVEENPPATPK